MGSGWTERNVTTSCCSLICVKAWKQTTMNTRLTVNDNIDNTTGMLRHDSLWGTLELEEGVTHSDKMENIRKVRMNRVASLAILVQCGKVNLGHKGKIASGRGTSYLPNTILGAFYKYGITQFRGSKNPMWNPQTTGLLWSSQNMEQLEVGSPGTALQVSLQVSLGSLITPLLRAH